MNEFETYMRFRDKKTSDVMYAKVVSRLNTGQYRCSKITDGSIIIASKANPADEFKPGTWVTVNFLGASKLAVGGSYVIVSRAPQEQKGLSASSPSNSAEEVIAPTVMAIEPNPIVLIAGGASEFAEIIGFGMSEPPSYSDSQVIDATPPSVSPTLVEIEVQASEAATVGYGHVRIHGTLFKNAIKVEEPEPIGPQSVFGVWLKEDNNLIAVNSTTGEVAQRYNNVTSSTSYQTILQLSDVGVAVIHLSGLFVVDTLNEGFYSLTLRNRVNPVLCDDKIVSVFISGSTAFTLRLDVVDVNTRVTSLTNVGDTTRVWNSRGTMWDGSVAWVRVYAGTSHFIFSFDPVTLTKGTLFTDVHSSYGRMAGFDADNLYLVNSAGNFRVISKADVSTVRNINLVDKLHPDTYSQVTSGVVTDAVQDGHLIHVLKWLNDSESVLFTLNTATDDVSVQFIPIGYASGLTKRFGHFAVVNATPSIAMIDPYGIISVTPIAITPGTTVHSPKLTSPLYSEL